MKAYLISLEKRKKEWGHPAKKLLTSLGLDVELITGVLCEKSLSKELNLGQSGCLLAHMKIADLISKNGPAFVFEDDIIPRKDLDYNLLNSYSDTFSDYDCYLLSSSQRGRDTDRLTYKKDMYVANKHTYGTFAMYYTPSVANLILEKFDSGELFPADHMFIKFVYLTRETPVIYPNLFIADERRSDIISGGYKDVETMQQKSSIYDWDLKNYDFRYRENF